MPLYAVGGLEKSAPRISWNAMGSYISCEKMCPECRDSEQRAAYCWSRSYRLLSLNFHLLQSLVRKIVRNMYVLVLLTCIAAYNIFCIIYFLFVWTLFVCYSALTPVPGESTCIELTTYYYYCFAFINFARNNVLGTRRLRSLVFYIYCLVESVHMKCEWGAMEHNAGPGTFYYYYG